MVADVCGSASVQIRVFISDKGVEKGIFKPSNHNFGRRGIFGGKIHFEGFLSSHLSWQISRLHYSIWLVVLHMYAIFLNEVSPFFPFCYFWWTF